LEGKRAVSLNFTCAKGERNEGMWMGEILRTRGGEAGRVGGGGQ